MPEKKTRFTVTYQIIIACLISYAICLGIRLLEAPLWEAQHLIINGEPLMATHDAYGWMAGAKGTGRKAGGSMSEILAFLHSLTGISLGTINFWLPAICAPLVVMPLCLLCAYWGFAEAGMLAGLLAGGSFGFLFRTRLGFGDTDILSLFFPLLLTTGLIWWLTPLIKEKWLKPKESTQANQTIVTKASKSKGKKQKSKSKPSPTKNSSSVSSISTNGSPTIFTHFTSLFRALIVGSVFLAYSWFYPGGYPVAMYTIIAAVVIAVLLRDWDNWQIFFGGLAVILAMGKLGWIGIGLTGIILLLSSKKKELYYHYRIGLWALLLVIVLFPVINGFGVITRLIEPVISYAKLFPAEEAGQIVLPSVEQSIREAQNIDLMQVMTRTGINWTFFIAGFIGYLWLIWKRPLAIAFAPMLLLSILAFKLGNRFAMYGGAAIGLGFGMALSMILYRLKQKQLIRWIFQLVLVLIISWTLWNVGQQFRPNPIMPKTYAQTLSELKKKTPESAQLWQWWDYGYAAQYYAERRTFSDGGLKDNYLFALALAHTTSSPQQGAQMIKFCAANQTEQMEQCEQNSTQPINPGAEILYYPVDPVKPLKDMEAPKAQAFVDSLAQKEKDWPKDLPPQYLVLSWENLHLAYWITYFGSWNLVTGKGIHGKIQSLSGQFKLDVQKGTVHLRNRKIPMKTLDILNSKDRRHLNWPSNRGVHIIANQAGNQFYIMDDMVYDSMMIQMLISDPYKFSDHFELVSDHFPWNRVYKVK